MTRDFVEDAIQACNQEKVPFVFAMRAGREGEWSVDYNLTHYKTDGTISKTEEVSDLISLSLYDEEQEP
tara:strand:- start:109 stop:315 length:207 start_codon:yes stop_codon:yes gene_type:complete